MENNEQPSEQAPIPPLPIIPPNLNRPAKRTVATDLRDLGRFLQVRGACIFYGLSAVCVAYGILKVMGPILSAGNTLRDGLPCFFTLHGYEAALLLALIVIVRRKVTDDAVSLLLIIALFLVGTAIAQGALADTDVRGSVYLGLLGIALGAAKLGLLRQVVRIPLGAWPMAGLMVMVAVNYLAPAGLGKLLAEAPSQETARRTLWLWMWLALLAGAGLTALTSLRVKNAEDNKATWPPNFLHTPLMTFVFVIMVLAGSSVHQYSMSFTFTLERCLGDYTPALALICLLLLEALWRSGKSTAAGDIVVACLPLGWMLWAVHQASVVETGRLGIGYLVYPPAALMWIGALLSWRHQRKQKGTWIIPALYGLGAVLTWGYSPERPYQLHYFFCGFTLMVFLWVYGLLKQKPYACWIGVILLMLSVTQWPAYVEAGKVQQVTLAKGMQVSQIGVMAGVLGLGTLIISLIFKGWNKTWLYIGAILLAVGIYDYLPANFSFPYIAVIVGTGIIIGSFWLRAKDLLVGVIPLAAILAKSYLASKPLAHWRFVVLGFILLTAGMFISLFKPKKNAD